MTNVTIENPVISVQLSNGESTTVPSGEIWDVTISHSVVESPTATSYRVDVNNVPISGRTTNSDGDNSSDSHGSTEIEIVLNAGDTISVNQESHQGSIHISGYNVA